MAATTNRRGFIQAAGAFAGLGLLPSWRAFAQRKAIDLTPFCYDHPVGSRYGDLTKPFAQDGMAYGTDARILCRTILADAPALGENSKLPAISELPWWQQESKWQPWPKRRLFDDDITPNTCPICWGRGGLEGLAPCVPCEGHGFITTGEDYESRCKRCQTTGWTWTLKCDYCGGKGETSRPCLQRVGSLVVAGHYDARVRGLGDVEFCISRNELLYKHLPPDTGVVRFRGDGFEGLLMPIDMDARHRRQPGGQGATEK